MGYESKVIVVNHSNIGLGGNKISYAEQIMHIDMCKMGDNEFYKLFSTPIDYTLFVDSANEARDTDQYGDKMCYAHLKEVIDYLEKRINAGDNYRRLPILLGMLKSIDESKWDEIQVVHFGY